MNFEGASSEFEFYIVQGASHYSVFGVPCSILF